MISINRKAVRAAGGTQSDELQAKIKSVTSSTTVGAVFVYDTRNDSDSGAWRKKARGSWYYEDLNTATRGGRREFPSVCLVVADTSGNTSVTIYDLDDPAMPAWMVFNGGNGYAVHHPDNAHVPSSLFALNGRIYLGQDGAGGELCVFDFVEDFAWMIDGIATNHVSRGPLVNRNTTQTGTSLGGSILVNSVVNDVAATYLEGGELDSLGLVRPVVACATNGGVSVIHPNGSVCDGHAAAKTKVYFTSNGSLLIGRNDSTNSYFSVVPKGNYFADGFTEIDFELTYAEQDNASAASYIPNFLGSNPQLAALAGDGIAVGCDEGLNIYKHNSGNKNESAVAYITSDYNSGMMLGDIRFAGLAGSGNAGQDVADRSVKANTLTKTGSITSTAVATSAELHAYSNFSASNYLSRANDTDFDFGTGDFSVMFWCKSSTTGSTNDFIARGDVTPEAGDFFIRKNSSEKIQLFRHNGSSYQGVINPSSSSIGTSWSQVVVTRSDTTVSIYVNGKREVSGTSSDTFTPSGGSAFTIGLRLSDTSVTGQHMSLSLIRISATAPTPQQVKEIYEAEKPLFKSGAKCLLQGGLNTVNGLSYDNSTELLTVSSSPSGADDPGVTFFRGLEAVSTFAGGSHGWSSQTAKHVASAGGVSAFNRPYSTGGVIVDLPSIDVRGDINTADTKLPDDGKLHFTGVTTSNGGDVIGHIPIGENENVTVKAHVTAKGYGSNLGTHYANYVLTEQFYRAAGGDVTSAVAEASIVSQESAAGLDATLGVDTSADTAKITVTGDASDRIVWTASVEVIRDAEKSYER